MSLGNCEQSQGNGQYQRQDDVDDAHYFVEGSRAQQRHILLREFGADEGPVFFISAVPYRSRPIGVPWSHSGRGREQPSKNVHL